MGTSTFHIVLNMDDGYIVHAVTMLTSVFVNNPDEDITVHILSSGLSEKVKHTIRQCIEGRYGQTVQFYDVDTADTDIFPEYVNSHINKSANYRLFVADILPTDIHKVLYLDCDLIVESPLKELFDADISNSAVAAVEDMWSGKDDNYERLGYDRTYAYFNSGVLLINIDWWRNHSLSKSFIDYLNNHENLKFVDQDILNGVLHDQWLSLPLRWNVQDGFLRSKLKIRKERRKELLRECRHPAIIHFTGSRKPWNYDCLNPYRDRYFHYLDMTPWMGERPVMPSRFKRKMILDNILYTLLLKPRKYRNIL